MGENTGAFKKGSGDQRDPRIKPYSKGDGRKRRRFPKGKVANPRLAEVRFQKGNVEGGLRESPKVYARTIQLIPQEYRIQVDPGASGLELVKILDDVIAFARQMQDMISRSANPMNNKATGRYTSIIIRCADTAAKIKGEKVAPAPYGRLKEGDVAKLKNEFAQTLTSNMAKMRHSIDYAKMDQETDEQGNVCYPMIFDMNGEVKTWASDGFCFLISGAREIIEKRAALDTWERGLGQHSDNIIEAHRRRMNR